MTTAQEIVEAMLDDRLTEARKAGLVRVFGPDVPDKGYFYAGADPLSEFFASHNKDIKPPLTTKEKNAWLKFFLKRGFVIWQQKNRGAIAVYHDPAIKADKLHPDAVKALEQTLGLSPKTVLYVNKKAVPASQFIYAQQPGGQQQQPGGHPPSTPTSVAQKKNMTLTATFGGLQAPTGSFQPVYKVNHREIQKGLKSGFAFVLKYPNGGFNVVTPRGYRFSKQAIQGLERHMGIKPSSLVHLFVDNTSHGKAMAASVAIYGQTPGGASQSP